MKDTQEHGEKTAHFEHRRGAGSCGGQHQGCRQHCSSPLGDSGDGNIPVQTLSAGDRDAATSLADTEQCLQWLIKVYPVFLQKVLCFQELLPHPELKGWDRWLQGTVVRGRPCPTPPPLQTIPAHPLCPPLTQTQPQSPAWWGWDPRYLCTPCCPSRATQGWAAACSCGADNGHDVGAGPGLVAGGLLLCFQEGEGALPLQCSHLS